MADTPGRRRSTRLTSHAPSLAPTLQSTSKPVPRRSPNKRTAATALTARTAAGSTTSSARTRPASSITLRGHSTANAESGLTTPRNPAVTSGVAAELEEHHARYSNAYGSPGQAAEPERLANSRVKATAGDALKAAVAEAKQNKTSALQHQIEPEPSVASGRSQSSVPSAPSKVESSNGSQSTRRSSARNFAAVGSANFIATGASISGSSSISNDHRSKATTSAIEDNASRRSDVSASTARASSSNHNAPAPRSATASTPWPSWTRFTWFRPLTWLLAVTDWVANIASQTGHLSKQILYSIWTSFIYFTSQTGRLSKRCLSSLWRLTTTLAPVLLALSLLAAVSLLGWVHVNSPTPEMSLFDRLTAPFKVDPGPPAPVASSPVPFIPDVRTTVACTNCDARLKVVEQALRHPVPARRQQEPLRKVNFFAPGSGVTVDPYLTSPSLPMVQLGKHTDPYKTLLARLTFGLLDSWSRQPGPSPSAIFLPWDDMGECWCASESNGKAQIGIVLSEPMVPQELVVEHMPASGLLRAQMDATPKDIEMWVQVEDRTVRAAVQAAALDLAGPSFDDGSTAHGSLPSSSADNVNTRKSLDDTWVRIGRFRYQLGGPQSQNFKIHVDMVSLGAPIDKLAIRTLNSWGEEDTAVCLYRMKLHGAVVEKVVEEPADG